MNKKKAIAAAVILACMAALYLISSTDLVLREQETPVYNVSVILNDVTDEYVLNFKKGVKQTFSEWKADVNYVTLYDKNDAAQQMELIGREIDNGAQAIILFPVEGESLNQYLEAENYAVPVICAAAPPPNGWADAYVHGDPEENARLLAEQILRDMGGEKQKVYLLAEQDHLREEQLMACRGIEERLGESGITPGLLKFRREEELPEMIKAIYHKERKAYFICLDPATQEMVMNNVPFVERSSLSFYCAGTTDRILYDISRGSIKGAAMDNEFDIGYLSMKAAIGLLSKQKVPRETVIGGYIVTRDNMYSGDMEKLIFPVE